MKTYDWIVVGNGLAGAAVGYELACQRYSVLVLEQSLQPKSATRYSYGGIPYWAGTNDLTRQLAAEGIERHRHLAEELGQPTGFRELDLLMPIEPGADSAAIAQTYQQFAIPPQLIDRAAACTLEPQLNPDAIAGALTVRHGHVNPMALVQAYNDGMQRNGGELHIAPVRGLVHIGDRITGVTTPTQAYAAGNVVVAAGAYSRPFLQAAGISLPLYFTHAELIQTPPVDLQLRTIVMAVELKRLALEHQASQVEMEAYWHTTPAEAPAESPNDEPPEDIIPPILDPGVIQFQDGSLCLGQISRVRSTLAPQINAVESEAQIRQVNETWIPSLKGIPGTWHHCPVSFSRDNLPLVGPISGIAGVHVFTGFSSPFSLLPPIAKRFAQWVNGAEDSLMEQMVPSRFD